MTTTTRFVSLSLLAGCLAFAAGSAASWLLGRAASVTGTGGDARASDLLPPLVAVDLEEEATAATPGRPRTIHVARFPVRVLRR